MCVIWWWPLFVAFDDGDVDGNDHAMGAQGEKICLLPSSFYAAIIVYTLRGGGGGWVVRVCVAAPEKIFQKTGKVEGNDGGKS